MRLIEFLLENFAFLLIILGIFSSLFSRSRRRDQHVPQPGEEPASHPSPVSSSKEKEAADTLEDPWSWLESLLDEADERPTEQKSNGSGQEASPREKQVGFEEMESSDIERRELALSKRPAMKNEEVGYMEEDQPGWVLPDVPEQTSQVLTRLNASRPNLPSSVQLNQTQLSPKHLLEGYIWSEVLAPPRARRPHPSLLTRLQVRR